MRFALNAALDAVRPHLSPALVDAAAYADLQRLATRLPPLATTFGLECRLGATTRIDLALSVEPANGGRAALAVLAPSPANDGGPEESAHAHPAWNRAQAFAKLWDDPTSSTHHWVPFAFLELAAEPSFAPSILAALDWPLDRDQLPRLREAAAEILTLLLERDCRREMERCFDLPRFARVLHVGAMLAQPARAMRVAVSVPHDVVPAYLAGIGHARDVAPLEEILARAERGLASPHPWRPRQIDFDAGDASGPLAIGVRPTQLSHWADLLAALVDGGLCLAEKRDALLAWHGTDEAHLDSPCRVRRYLSHVQISLAPGAPPEAKVHIGARPHFPPLS